MRFIPTTSKRQLEFVNDRLRGLTYRQIAAKYQTSHDIIAKYLKLHNITTGKPKQKNTYKKYTTAIELFNDCYIINDKTDCWEWQRTKTQRGYGQMWFNKTTIGAHRFSYLHFKGKINNDLYVLHICDNPCCVNPEHLFLGTPKQNMIDKINKNRHRKLNLKKANLTKVKDLNKQQKIDLVGRKHNGEKICDLAKEFNLSYDNLVMFFKRTHLTS